MGLWGNLITGGVLIRRRLQFFFFWVGYISSDDPRVIWSYAALGSRPLVEYRTGTLKGNLGGSTETGWNMFGRWMGYFWGLCGGWKSYLAEEAKQLNIINIWVVFKPPWTVEVYLHRLTDYGAPPCEHINQTPSLCHAPQVELRPRGTADPQARSISNRRYIHQKTIRFCLPSYLY